MGFEYYVKQMEEDNVDAILELGNMYFEGKNIKKDTKKALKLYASAARKGNREALYKLGYIYEKGICVKKDYKKSIEYYEKAIKLGEKNSLHKIINIYMSGKVEMDYEKLKEYYKKLESDAKDEEKALALTQKYLNGEIINYKELFELKKREMEKDPYYKKIKNKLDNNSRVLVIRNIKELTKDKLENIPDDIIISMNPNTTFLGELCAHFYTVHDMKKIIDRCYKILEQIDLNQNEEDIFMQIYIKLGKLISYDYGAIINEQKNGSTSRNLMVIINNKGVCEGYATALKYLLNMVGIECKVLNSELDKKGYGHAYNQVKINNKWYFCDLTDDHNYMKLYTVKSCLKSKDTFTKTILIKKEDIYHKTINIEEEYDSEEDYPNVQSLFLKNYIKLTQNNISKTFCKKKITPKM